MAETLKLPKEVINSDWRDDVPSDIEDTPIDYAIYGANEKEEASYISPKRVSRESIKRIKEQNRRIGLKLLLLASEEKLAA